LTSVDIFPWFLGVVFPSALFRIRFLMFPFQKFLLLVAFPEGRLVPPPSVPVLFWGAFILSSLTFAFRFFKSPGFFLDLLISSVSPPLPLFVGPVFYTRPGSFFVLSVPTFISVFGFPSLRVQK